MRPDALDAASRELLALHLVSGVGPRVLRGLLERFGNAGAALRASVAELQEVPHVGERLAAAIVRAGSGEAVIAELELAAKLNVAIVVRGQEHYPTALVEIPDSPAVLYLRGDLTPADHRAVALVGSRHCTPYGRRVAATLAGGLARAGYTVVSGLARGIDGAAHRAALDAGGRTIAVVAGGLSSIYPPEHAQLAEEVTAAGALVTESCLKQDPIAGLFHARNRIISGLSLAVVIVEAAGRSGALITATHAAEQGRPVLAVPGPTDSTASDGCHALIRKGAILCRGIDDILEEFHGVSTMAAIERGRRATDMPAAPSGPPPGLDETQSRLWEFLSCGTRSVDEMAQQLGIPVSQLTTTLMLLEMRKVIRRLPGNRYERC